MNVSHLLRVTCLAASCAALASTPPSPAADYGKLPLAFQPNIGQTSPNVNYLAHGRDYTIFFTPQNTTLTLRKDAKTAVALQFAFARSSPAKPVAEAPTASLNNFYIGRDPSRWKTNVPSYARIRYANIYPGTDAIFYGDGQKLEYDLEVAPHADPSRIALAVNGADKFALDHDGNLVISALEKSVVFHRPVSYQVIAGVRREVKSAFRLNPDGTIGFALGSYNRTQPLVIDPTLLYSTFIGGSNDDYSRAIAIDGSGNAYITGETLSTDYPTTPGAFNNASTAFYKLIATKLNPSGTAVVYSTEFGGFGGGDDDGTGIAVDSTGDAYISATVNPNQFPTTAGVVEPTSQNQYFSGAVVKLNPQGGLVWSTFVGSAALTQANAIALDSSNNPYITGSAQQGLPTTANAFQRNNAGSNDAFVIKLNQTASQYLYVTYLGGGYQDQGNAIAVDGMGAAYVTGIAECNHFPSTPNAYQKYCDASGQDIFVVKLDPSGSTLQYGTFLHAPSGSGYSIALDSNLNAYVTGDASPGMPTSPGAFQPNGAPGMQNPVIAKINASGSALLYGTYLGGSDYSSQALGIKVDPNGNAYVTGSTQSANFPVTSNAYQSHLQLGRNPLGSAQNAFASVLNSGGTGLLYSTYFGTEYVTSYAVGLDTQNDFFITGDSGANNIPTTSGAYQTTNKGGADAWVAKFSAVSNGGGGGGGGCLPSGPGAKICQPSNGSTVVTPFTLQAGATAASGDITAIRVYDNNTSVLTVNNPQATQSFQINQQLNLAPGQHNIVVVGYQSTGGAQTASENIIVQTSGGSCVPLSPGVNICKPAASSTVASPVEVQAGALSSSGNITAMRVYVDNVAVGTVNNPSPSSTFQIDQFFTLASGTHHLVVVAYLSNGSALTNGENITVP